MVTLMSRSSIITLSPPVRGVARRRFCDGKPDMTAMRAARLHNTTLLYDRKV
jgi:hypothetical protein